MQFPVRADVPYPHLDLAEEDSEDPTNMPQEVDFPFGTANIGCGSYQSVSFKNQDSIGVNPGSKTKSPG